MEHENIKFIFQTGIIIRNKRLPSGVYSALEEANITRSVLDSDNDVKLRWIAEEEWTYSLNFNGNRMHFLQ